MQTIIRDHAGSALAQKARDTLLALDRKPQQYQDAEGTIVAQHAEVGGSSKCLIRRRPIPSSRATAADGNCYRFTVGGQLRVALCRRTNRLRTYAMPRVTAIGKRQLFFSPNHADKEWRLKERLVALIESYLQGIDDVLTFSPAFPRNCAGDAVEVDAGFASVSNPTRIFEFAQVRDRRRRQGRPWIEQILGQKHSLKCGSPIVVSPDGFTDQAIRLAESKQILLRELLSESVEDSRLWYRPDHIELHLPTLRIAEVNLTVDAGGAQKTLYGDAEKSSEPNVLIPTGINRWSSISLDSILSIVLRRDEAAREQFFSTLPKNNVMHQRHIPYDTLHESLFLRVDGPSAAAFATDNPVLRIVKIDFYVEATQGANRIPVQWRYRYQVPSGELIAQCVGGGVRVDDKTWYGVMVRVHDNAANMARIGAGLF